MEEVYCWLAAILLLLIFGIIISTLPCVECDFVVTSFLSFFFSGFSFLRSKSPFGENSPLEQTPTYTGFFRKSAPPKERPGGVYLAFLSK